jgi:hypothetical protein
MHMSSAAYPRFFPQHQHRHLQRLDSIQIRLPRRGQLAGAAVRERPRGPQTLAVARSVRDDVVVALEVRDQVVDEGVDLRLVLSSSSAYFFRRKRFSNFIWN